MTQTRAGAPAIIVDTDTHDAVDRAARRLERMRRAPHFVNGRFRNAGENLALHPSRTFAMARELVASRGVQRRPPRALPMVSPLSVWTDAPRTGLRATWLGHSTVLLELDGARMLTDPVWALRASPLQSVGPRRFHAPPVSLKSLPRLDAVLVSHDHYDHLDADAVRVLAKESRATFVTSLGVGGHLERFGVPARRIVELDWWESAEIPGTRIEVTAVPAQHFSGRGATDRNRTLWAGYVFASRRHRVFFSGDTGLGPAFGKIGQKLGPFDLVMLEVGAYNANWREIHLGPWQAMEGLTRLGGGPLLPIHWGTFDLAFHAWDEPIVVLEAAAIEDRLALVAPRLGEPRDVLAEEDLRRARHRMDAWWRLA